MNVRVGRYKDGMWSSTHDDPRDLDVCSLVISTSGGSFPCTNAAVTWHVVEVLSPHGVHYPTPIHRCGEHAPGKDEVLRDITRDEATAAVIMGS